MLINLKRLVKNILLIVIILLIIFIVYLNCVSFFVSDSIDFDGLSLKHHNLNVTGLGRLIVPNIVHLIQFDNPFISFITFLCIKAAIKFQSPDVLIIHTNEKQLNGKYWDRLKENEQIQVEKMVKPTEIFNLPLAHVYHSSDVARLIVLMKYGGIYIDSDLLILKDLNSFRRFECSIGWPENEFIGNQLIIAHKDSRFIKKWFQSYKYYNGSSWYFNAGQLPTQSILNSNPEYVHRETKSFGVAPEILYLYSSVNNKSDWIDKFHTIHLLERHRSYLIPSDSIRYFNEFNIKSYNKTFGSMARDILFDSPRLIT
ncbi:uncharacterized protein LOC128389671 isoform X1 [Panonychus citri]|uniref:uncharacterized protein LOC128389671 isoform X1 n=2 Tax=Panonychus citri TaxID=50023 RepID=UPI002307D7E4|nr:uncharacterized protein LOC128389671 isoform X1 [Panonychus citri]